MARGRRLGRCRVASLPLCPFSLGELLVPCLVMGAQEESSNSSEIWKMIIDAGIVGFYGNRQMPGKNPDPRIALYSIWPLEHCSKNLSRLTVLISPCPLILLSLPPSSVDPLPSLSPSPSS